jgi:hypothetical protein
MTVEVEAAPAATDSTQARLREAVEALSAIDRRATSEGERRSAAWVAEELTKSGAREVRLSSYTAHSTWAIVTAAHMALALALSIFGGRVGRLLPAALVASLEADASGRRFWLRNILPGRRRGTNAEARIAARGPTRRTVVVVAHHDAAHNGFIWHPLMLAASRWRARRTGMTPSYSSAAMAGMLAVAAPLPLVRDVGRAMLGAGIALSLQAALSKTVPAANDNASGVAGLLELTRRLAADSTPGLEVIVLSPGGEEAGGVGIAGWLKQEGPKLDPATTLFVGLDSIGSGEPVVSVRESVTGRYRAADVELVERAAERAGVARPRRVGLGAVSDPMVARYRGFRAVSLLSWRDGMIANLHRPTDIPENVDWASAERLTDLAYGVIQEWAHGAPAAS